MVKGKVQMKTDSEKVLLLDIEQPFAHYREPKVMQDDYIPTLNLPPATTVAGMVSYLIDRQLKTKYRIGIVGTYESKLVEFIRGEVGSFLKDYEKLIKDKQKSIQKNHELQLDISELYNYQKKTSKNRIMYFEVLQNVKLKIFLSTENNELVKKALEKPLKYLSLGRKEDFIMPVNKGESFVKEIEIEKVFIENKKEAIKDDLIFKNTYIPVDIKSCKSRNIMQEGILYSLPKIYKDLNAEKKDRVIQYGHYVYLNNNGAYLSNIEGNIYRSKNENILFTWL
jgi:CRISPR-associated Cas5-like protein